MRWLYSIIFIILLSGCNLPDKTPPPDPFALATEIALTGEPTPANQAQESTDLPAAVTPTIEVTSEPTPTSDPEIPSGKIAYVCQIFKVQVGDQICIMNADGSNQRRLTSEDYTRHFYPSMAPDGNSVVYVQFGGQNVYNIYEMTLDGENTQITDGLGVLTAPEISPDGSQIAFTHWSAKTNKYAIWAVDRDGSNPREVSPHGWDPTWSPDGEKILFASDHNGTVKMYIVTLDDGSITQVNNMTYLRGRTDWSINDEIVTYSGKPWNRELYLMNADGSNVQQITPSGGNSQGPSFSPDGNWVTFTAYFDLYGDDHGCEIYIMRTDGSDLRRLTDNDYCDWQPRWGP